MGLHGEGNPEANEDTFVSKKLMLYLFISDFSRTVEECSQLNCSWVPDTSLRFSYRFTFVFSVSCFLPVMSDCNYLLLFNRMMQGKKI